MRRTDCIVLTGLLLILSGCSTKKNNFFTRQYHELTTRYNVYFNGNEALKGGVEKMERNHREDYTNLLPVFVSNDERTRALCQSDMNYAIEKAVKAIDEHSITVKPKRRRNKDSKNYENFRKQKEFNDQIAKCYLLLGKAYFYNRKYTMAGNTFRYIQRQYPEDEALLTEVQLWLFRNLSEQERYEEAAPLMAALENTKLNRTQREMYVASKTDFYIRQQQYGAAIPAAEELIRECKSLKRKPRYQFLLSQLYLKEGQDALAAGMLKKAVRFNFDYEMVFNAKINMALAYREGDGSVKKRLNKMLKDAKNEDFQDRIYYALASIEEKEGEQEKAVEYYWKSVRSSVDNDNQKSLSFLKLGEYYYNKREYIPAQSCYDSCLFFMDSRIDGYEALKDRVTDLTELVTHLTVIQRQDSLQRVAELPEAERKALIDEKIRKVKEAEEQAKEAEQLAMQERSFFMRNDMMGQRTQYNVQNSGEGEWYFYNPVTISLGENEFKRKWGRRRLEDNWRRQNKAMMDPGESELLAVEGGEQEEGITDTKNAAFYLQDLPLTEEKMEASRKMVETAYYHAGEMYLYKFDDPEKALACFEEFIRRYPEGANIVSAYYLAYESAGQAGKPAVAEQYKGELLRRFPESDLAKGLQDPAYFRKMDSDLEAGNRMYEEAYGYYRDDYYPQALALCEEILRKYPENKLRPNVLLLRAMCMVNLRPESEARAALLEVTESKPNREILGVVNGILASMDVGDQPVLYTDANMADARSLRSTRNWQFDREEQPSGREEEKESPYQFNKEQEHYVAIVLPDSLKTTQNLQIQGRLAFINAGEQVAQGSKYEVKKETWWYKTEALEIGLFKNADQALGYVNRVGTDKTLLKNFRGGTYRLFAVGKENLPVVKRMRDVEGYVDFFIENYFTDKAQGEIISGRQGATAHLFNFDAGERHDFVLLLPFRKVNMNRIAEEVRRLDPAFGISREKYDSDLEMMVVKNIGNQEQAMDYLNSVSKSREIFEMLRGVNYRMFVVTPVNRAILQEYQNIEEYMQFFSVNYLSNQSAEIGVEEGDFVYKTDLPHKFVLFYPNQVDPFRLKAGFEQFNPTGLTLNNYKYDDTRDMMVVSGFVNKEESMRYFYAAVNDRKLFRDLRNADYRNFIITEGNLDVLREKREIEQYLLFFKKYYLDN
ncbi:MAG: hypothetical protein LBR65_00140 [Culturomica sp.]|nr:hypothetical protein [Culturomica sp.]